jgi:hypothetical protein
MEYKGQTALSLNAFIYRERGVLIGHFLCEVCAKQVLRSAKVNPYHQTSIRAEIERNLIAAYHNHIKNIDA